ncbi:MAG TPA: hypothetical protein VIY48_04890 [Candidatus Paceibacterota bacterium]
MTIAFDHIKALSEEITGLADVAKAITIRERRAERDMTEAEAELMAMRKLSGFVQAELNRKRAVLTQLQNAEGR